MQPFTEALQNSSARVQAAAIVGLGRLGRKEAAEALLEVPVPTTYVAPAKGTEGPHATPNAAIIPAHLAVQALVSLDAVDACIQAIGTDHSTLALWALRYMHDPKAVEGLIYAYKAYKNQELQAEILTTLSRIYQKEAPYDGSWWWSTRPDTHGPYYQAIAWESSPAIKELFGERKKQIRCGGQAALCRSQW